MSLIKNNKELIEIYRKTINNIEKDIKYIKLLNKFILRKPQVSRQEALALETVGGISLQSSSVPKKKSSGRIYTFDNGDVYIGKIIDEKMEGKGSYIFAQEDSSQPIEYIGEFKDNLKDGNGMYILPNKNIYIGQWKNDVIHGIGKMIYDSKDEYLGNWKNGKKEGHGIYTWKNGGKYIGDFKSGKMDGIGVCYDNNERIIYEGEWKNNLAHGNGTYMWEDNKTYIGEFRHGKKHGYGTFYVNGEISYQGSWKFDKPVIFHKTLDELLSKLV